MELLSVKASHAGGRSIQRLNRDQRARKFALVTTLFLSASLLNDIWYVVVMVHAVHASRLRDVVLGTRTRTRVQLEYKFEVLVLVLVLVPRVLVLVLVLVVEVLVYYAISEQDT